MSARYVTEIPITMDFDDSSRDPFLQGISSHRALTPDFQRSDSPDNRFRYTTIHRTVPKHQNITQLSSSPKYGSLPRHFERSETPMMKKTISVEQPTTQIRTHPRVTITNSYDSQRPPSPGERTSSPLFDNFLRHNKSSFDDEIERLKNDFFNKSAMNEMNFPGFQHKDMMFPDDLQVRNTRVSQDNEIPYQNISRFSQDHPDYTSNPTIKRHTFSTSRPSVVSQHSTSSGSDLDLSPASPLDNEWSVEFDLHDYEPEHLKVHIKNDELVIKAVAHVVEGGRNITKEYSNAVQLPSEIHQEQLIAQLSLEGILTVYNRAPPSYESIKFEASRQN